MALLDLSASETSQQTRNAAGIEKIAGEVYGNQALPFGKLNTASQMPGLPTVNTTARTSPTKPPKRAPRVVRPRQSIDSNRTGKFALAATAKARPTMKATLRSEEHTSE